MSEKYQWYFCNLVLIILLLTACASPATGISEVETSISMATKDVTGTATVMDTATVETTPTIIPRSGDLIFVEFFAIT
jgi:hypothetical protein